VALWCGWRWGAVALWCGWRWGAVALIRVVAWLALWRGLRCGAAGALAWLAVWRGGSRCGAARAVARLVLSQNRSLRPGPTRPEAPLGAPAPCGGRGTTSRSASGLLSTSGEFGAFVSAWSLDGRRSWLSIRSIPPQGEPDTRGWPRGSLIGGPRRAATGQLPQQILIAFAGHRTPAERRFAAPIDSSQRHSSGERQADIAPGWGIFACRFRAREGGFEWHSTERHQSAGACAAGASSLSSPEASSSASAAP
jgi:hypothetical protein